MTVNIDKRKYDAPVNEIPVIEKKIQRLGKFFQDPVSADVRFSDKKGTVTAEITIRTEKLFFRAEQKAADTLSAVDGAVDAISRQIRKNKTKLEKRLKVVDIEPIMGDQDFLDDELVRRKHFELKPMTEQDALLQMELLNHSFYVFKNSELGNSVCVCYKRNDGGTGIIETN